MRIKFFLFCLSFLIVFQSCFLKKETEILLSDSDPLALSVDVEWAVVTDPYATFRVNKEWDSQDTGHVKKGTVLKVVGYSFSSEHEKWVKFEDGYLPQKSVVVYSNKYQADTEARKLETK
ncbi:MAG: hypothetical protein HUK25_02565 [Treponema sp.]|nr:hypothetical protein [Treponema sp.]